ncbi:MAG: sugar kinase [Paracoccaceae bacterium]|nr:sugar kinase [Paracoccaceae bacterium]
MVKVACIGEAMIELSLRERQTNLGVAGDTLNTAVYLKRAAPQIEVDYITRLGSDPFSAQITAFITAQNLGTAAIEISEHRHPGLYAISTSDDGERSFTYWRSQSAAKQLFQSPSGPSFECLERYDAIYLSGITLAILPDEMCTALLDYLRQSEQTLAFDSNYRPALWTSRSKACDVMQQFWQRADIALPSIDDEMLLWDQNEAEVIVRFAALGSDGALKRGASGPLSLSPIDQANLSFAPSPKVVDTTAAGDSFNGAYLAARLTGAPQEQALMAGHRCASHVVQYPGAIVPHAPSEA